ncbi:MAG: hypothetical protein JJE15_03315 [Desulfobacteraceae bacterium]|nr:hypothetical protein [Desulfobacteraceae bacterium]
MNTQDIIEQIGLKSLSKFEHREVDGVIISDMISDVMAVAKSGNLWITIQTHRSIIPAAHLVDVSAIIIAHGKEVPQETIDLASKHNVPIVATELSTFELAGKLHELGLGKY